MPVIPTDLIMERQKSTKTTRARQQKQQQQHHLGSLLEVVEADAARLVLARRLAGGVASPDSCRPAAAAALGCPAALRDRATSRLRSPDPLQRRSCRRLRRRQGCGRQGRR